MSKKHDFNLSDFYCTECGRKGMPIPRSTSRVKEGGHLKRLWCIYCQKEVNHAEVRGYGSYTYQDFMYEFNHGGFKNGERVRVTAS